MILKIINYKKNMNETRKCEKCLIEKDVSCFNKLKKTCDNCVKIDNAKRTAKWKSKNKERDRISRKKRYSSVKRKEKYEKNKEYYSLYGKEYYKKNKKKKNENSREWYLRNRDNDDFKERRRKYRIENADKTYYYSLKYRKNNKQKMAENKKRRRSREYNAVGSHTNEEWEGLKRYYNYTCPLCKRSEPEIKLTEDHIIPLSKGGSSYLTNIQPLCKSCNSMKNTKTIIFDNFLWRMQSIYSK